MSSQTTITPDEGYYGLGSVGIDVASVDKEVNITENGTTTVTDDTNYINKLTINTNVSLDQVQADWNETDTTAKSYIQNKPTLATVATSGSYNDLSDLPTIPSSDDFVTIGTEQTITGSKTFTIPISVNTDNTDGRFVIQLNDITIGTTPTANHFVGFRSADSTGKEFANVNCSYKNDGSIGSNFYVTNSDGKGGSLGIYIKEGETTPYTIAPTPATDDSSTKIATTAFVKAQGYAVGSSLSTVATSGSYNDLTDKPTIPSGIEIVDLKTATTAKKVEVYNAFHSGDLTKFLCYYNSKSLIYIGLDGSYVVFCDLIPYVVSTSTTYTKRFLNSSGSLSYVYKSYLYNNTITINQGTTKKGSFTLNQSSDATITLDAVPTKTSELTNDSNFVISTSLATVATSGSYNDLSDKPTIPSLDGYATESWVEGKGYAVGSSLATVATSGSYNDLSDKPTIPSLDGYATESWVEGKGYVIGSTLSTVATSGSYTDLTNKPTIPDAQIQADWDETDTTSKAYIQNKPSLSTVATSGSYNDLSDLPTIPSKTSELTNDSNFVISTSLATVATSGSYNDLTDTPTIPSLEGYATESWVEGKGYAVGSSLSTVATSGSYTDLSNKPTIPDAQIQSDWDETDTTSKAYIINKPTIKKQWYGTLNEYNAITVKDENTDYFIKGAISYDELEDKPTIPSKTSELTNDSNFVISTSLATVATSGSYNDLTDTPTIPAEQVQADWSATDTTSKAYIVNKPSTTELIFTLEDGTETTINVYVG